MTDTATERTSGSLIDALLEIKARYVDQALAWYRSRTRWPRLVFRAVGSVLIVLSLSVPFLAAVEAPWGKYALQLASFMIAALTALNSFFGWQRTWEKRINAQLTLEGLIALWQTEIAAAKEHTDPSDGCQRALKATQELIEKTKSLTTAEAGEFFATIRFPAVPVEAVTTKNGAP